MSLLLLVSGCHHAFGTGDDEFDLAVPYDLSYALAITPANPIIVVQAGQKPTLMFTATVGNTPVAASWQTDRGELGAIDQAGLYSTTGNLGGKALIKANYNGLTGTTIATIQYKLDVNGDPKCGHVGVIGPGGYGGVGGNGPGCPATPDQITALNTTPTDDPAVRWLYPYDTTIFPRGLLAPLMMWDPAAHSFDSLRLQMTAKGGTFVYDGTFSKPPGKPFVNLPIPQDDWEKMNLSASGDQVTLVVTFGEGQKAVGTETFKWRIAAGTLKGIVYYNSYGTALVNNSGEDDAATPKSHFGAGTLGIKAGKTDPVLIAGVTSNDNTGCRVCHSVSKDGSRLVTQRGNDYQISRLVDLKNGNVESAITTGNSAFPAMYPDGSRYFSSSGGMVNGDKTGYSALYALPAGNVVPATLPLNFQAALPSFSPDGTQLAFNFYGGAGSDMRSLAMMSFNGSNNTFGPVMPLYTPASDYKAVWPSFLPTNRGVVFETEVETHEFGYTRNGNKGQLWWVDVTSKSGHALDQLNGLGYLPTGNMHDADTNLNYEPTVNPVPSGGYAWVVFTSRRMYGNVAAIDPFLSDPRSYDWKNQITTKKLWVAAVDLNAMPGTDPSHPAFYLPAQELHAGNSRGFWTVDPCHPDGQSCETGDECCGGYCQNVSDPDAGNVLSCSSNVPLCAKEFEKCTIDNDCCKLDPSIDPTGQISPTCINGYCSTQTPTPIL